MSGPVVPRKPPVGSRTPTSRPRRVAGGVPASVPAAPAPVESGDDGSSGSGASGGPVVLEKQSAPARRTPTPTPDRPRRSTARLRVVLVGAIVVLLGLGTWELVTVLKHDGPEDRPVGRVTTAEPVQVSELTVRSVVDQAAQATVLIASASAQDYDAGVDKAAATMTDPFAEKYRTAKADVKDQVVAQGLEVTAEVEWAGVVTASRTEIVVLVFYTQSTIAGTGPVTPRQFRQNVTMVPVDGGWLVADVDAGDLLDNDEGDG